MSSSKKTNCDQEIGYVLADGLDPEFLDVLRKGAKIAAEWCPELEPVPGDLNSHLELSIDHFFHKVVSTPGVRFSGCSNTVNIPDR